MLRSFIFALSLLVGACASARSDGTRESIDVIYHPGAMEYSITDGGPARLVGADNQRVFEFETSHRDYRRVADLLEPLKDGGLTCSSPPANARLGYIVWRRGSEEVRRVEMYTACYADGVRPLSQNTDRAWRAMDEMGRARYGAPVIPAPTTIALENMYWGNTTSRWTISRGGEGRFVEGERVVTFPVSVESFDSIREIFRPYESRHFECNRTIADGPYGYVIWSSREGQEDQRTLWDAGCVTGDAADLFARLDQASAILVALRDASASAPRP